MEIPENNIEKWWKMYSSLSKEKYYDFFKETFKKPLSKKFNEKIDIVDLLINLFGELEFNKEYDKILDIINLLYDNNEHILQKTDYQYIDKNIININLFKGEFSEVDFKNLRNNSVELIDNLIELLDKIVFYKYSDLALDISKQVYFEVKDAPDLIGGAEINFGSVICMSKWQSIYEDLNDGKEIVKEEVIEYFDKYGYDIKDRYDEIIKVLSANIERPLQADYNLFLDNKFNFLYKYKYLFYRYLYQKKNMDFMVATKFWYGAFECIGESKLAIKTDNKFDVFFKLDRNKLENYVKKRLSFLSNQKVYAVGVLWGIPYVYDFLFANNLVSEVVYSSAIDIVEEIKRDIIANHINQLWKYDFVHFWQKADAIEESKFKKEAELFKNSFYKILDNKEYLSKIANNKRELNFGKKAKNKVRRNAPCICGSGKKHKKCCLKRMRKQERKWEKESYNPRDLHWMPQEIEEMNIEAIIDLLFYFGVYFSKEGLAKDLKKYDSIEEIVDSYFKRYEIRARGFDEKFLYFAVEVLKDRLMN